MIPRLPLLLLMALSALCYHAALWLEHPGSVWLTAGWAVGLCAMVRARTARRAFYAGIGAALLVAVPQLWFLTGIFKSMAIPLWLTLAMWTGFFTGTLHVIHRKGGIVWTIVLAPVLWMGFEFFRTEVWMLRFAWLTPGFALPAADMGWLFQSLGVYGSGALIVMAGTAIVLLKHRTALATAFLLPLILLIGQHPVTPAGSVRITGVQFEEALPEQLLEGLEAARTAHPGTALFVLPEYSFSGPVPEDFMRWCQQHQVYLIAGGKDYLRGRQNRHREPAYHNTAFVIGPDGTVEHRQSKAMPIQFFDDGEPATTQTVWPSPWGKLGICICYDQNYRMVTDPLAAQQMQALIIPTLDLQTWGPHQHWLSARLAATRAAEYGVPVIRLASSGISQFLDSRGRILASGALPGDGEIVSAEIPLSAAARLPWDRYPAPWAIYPATAMLLWALTVSFIDNRRRMALPLPAQAIGGEGAPA